jgi:hypothetical protein
MKKSFSLLKSTNVELVFNINYKRPTVAWFTIISSDRKACTTTDTITAVNKFHSETVRLAGEALKLLENRTAKPWQNVVGKSS